MGIESQVPWKRRSQMKSLCWVLSFLALLVISTLDARPDPPAVNPATVLSKILDLHQDSDEAAIAAPASAWTIPDFHRYGVLVDAPACRPVDNPDFTALASDPSPPLT